MSFAPENENPIQFNKPIGGTGMDGDAVTKEQKELRARLEEGANELLEPKDFNGIEPDALKPEFPDQFRTLDSDTYYSLTDEEKEQHVQQTLAAVKNKAAQHGGIAEVDVVFTFKDGSKLPETHSLYPIFLMEYIKYVVYEGGAQIVPIPLELGDEELDEILSKLGIEDE